MRLAPLAFAICLLAFACTSGKDGGADARAAADSAPAMTCAAIRACIFACKTNTACADACAAAAPAAARTRHEEVVACTSRQCPRGSDENCRCTAECYVPGPCVELVDRCTAGEGDPYCEETCH
jgi:hypothetical protein